MTTATAVTVKHLDTDDITALYRHYQGQTSPQGCYIELDTRNGELTADWNAEIGNGVPASVYHQIVLRWDIPTLTAPSANRLLDKLATLATQVLAGATTEWDGNNHVGKLTADARAAADDIEAHCQEAREEPFAYDVLGEYDAGDWFGADAGYRDSRYVSSEEATAENLGITAATTDTQLEELAADAEREALTAQEPAVLTGALKFLTGIRDNFRNDDSD